MPLLLRFRVDKEDGTQTSTIDEPIELAAIFSECSEDGKMRSTTEEPILLQYRKYGGTNDIVAEKKNPQTRRKTQRGN